MTAPSPPKKTSDLGARTLSAIVMVAVAGTALWLGGWGWMVFVGAVGLGVLWEWWSLVRKITQSWWERVAWLAGGVGYVGVAIAALIHLPKRGIEDAIMPILLVAAVDVGAYFAGRSIGGPKIAPKISPSKTWAGLIGGCVVAILLLVGIFDLFAPLTAHGRLTRQNIYFAAAAGTLIAIIAQTGDFFESWMKRRAGVKDSGSLIPGHGGLFDRVDGLLAVCFVLSVMMWVGQWW